MLPDRVSNPGPLTYESDALPIALRGPAGNMIHQEENEYMYIIHAQMILESKCILTEISITPSLSPTIYKFETHLKDL